MIKGALTGVLEAVGFGAVFGLLALSGLVFKKQFQDLFGKFNFSVMLHSFWIGGLIAFILHLFPKTTSFSIINILAPSTEFSVLSTVTQGMDAFSQVFATITIAPFSESMFALIPVSVIITYAVSFILGEHKKPTQWIWWKQILLMVIMALLSGVLFFLLHYGLLASMTFLLSAIAFRSLVILVGLGDRFFPYLIPILVVTLFLEFGFHLIHNILEKTTGFIQFSLLMFSNPYGMVFYTFFIGLLVLEIYNISRFSVRSQKAGDTSKDVRIE